MNDLSPIHLTEADLVDLYYGEASREQQRHLRGCAQCSSAYASLERDLSAIKPIEAPAREAGYGAHIWENLSPTVSAHKLEKKSRTLFGLNLWQTLSFATACAVLLAAAFFAGRQWEHHTTQQPNVAQNQPAASSDQGPKRVVLVVLGDHLDRSERLLVSLNHGDSAAPVQAEARDLLSANRLYRQSAAEAGDPALASALDHLERVLVEVANQPGGLTPERMAKLQKEMNTDGLLFEVRVLRSHMQDETAQPQTQPQTKTAAATKGVSI